MLTFNGPFLKVLKYPNKTVSIEAMTFESRMQKELNYFTERFCWQL